MQNFTPSTPSTPPESPDMRPSLIARLRAWLASGSGLSRPSLPPFNPFSINDAVDAIREDHNRRTLETMVRNEPEFVTEVRLKKQLENAVQNAKDALKELSKVAIERDTMSAACTRLAEQLIERERQLHKALEEKFALASVIADRDATEAVLIAQRDAALEVAEFSASERAALHVAVLAEAESNDRAHELNSAIQYAVTRFDALYGIAWLTEWNEGDIEADDELQQWKSEQSHVGGTAAGVSGDTADGPDELRIMQDCMEHGRPESAPVQPAPTAANPEADAEQKLDSVPVQPPPLIPMYATSRERAKKCGYDMCKSSGWCGNFHARHACPVKAPWPED